jgi:hypothetical protein
MTASTNTYCKDLAMHFASAQAAYQYGAENGLPGKARRHNGRYILEVGAASDALLYVREAIPANDSELRRLLKTATWRSAGSAEVMVAC